MPKLTEKQKRFCEEYLIDLNATQAAKRAGYSEKTAFSIGVENLKKPLIQEYLQELMNERAEQTGVTAGKVVKELERIAFADTEITGKEKMKALELLGKHLGMFTEKAVDEQKDNNLITAIIESSREDISTDDLREIQQTSESNPDVVEQT